MFSTCPSVCASVHALTDVFSNWLAVDFSLCECFSCSSLTQFLQAGCSSWHPTNSVKAPKDKVMRCWCGYLSGVRCRLFAYGPADATASQNPLYLASFKSRLILPFWYRLTRVVWERRPLNGCGSCCCCC